MNDRAPGEALADVEAPSTLPLDGRDETSVGGPSGVSESIDRSPFAKATAARGFTAVDPAVVASGTSARAIEASATTDTDGHSAEGTLSEIEDMPLRLRSDTLEDDLSLSAGGAHRSDDSERSAEAYPDDADLADFEPVEAAAAPAVTPAYGSVAVSGLGNTGYTPAAPPALGAPATAGFFSRLASRCSAALSSVARRVRSLLPSATSAPATPSLETAEYLAPRAQGRSTSIDLGSEREAAPAEITESTREDARARARSVTQTDDIPVSRGPSL